MKQCKNCGNKYMETEGVLKSKHLKCKNCGSTEDL